MFGIEKWKQLYPKEYTQILSSPSDHHRVLVSGATQSIFLEFLTRAHRVPVLLLTPDHTPLITCSGFF